ncbi:TonB-dependent receptor [Pseudodesulfovibrio cashew]|uniref:TonB-dependent receptor n=1 Tax=Pseudodesulfovibrio cashew TaxID=2678688 RepID=A0A6I6JKL9_9BACT|nr:TonB-dependent receptor [Pseudodesulfovibrio cashew]QGY41729.1 TonB-dependent receptor [Pseudodesulfovibrio cashew]
MKPCTLLLCLGLFLALSALPVMAQDTEMKTDEAPAEYTLGEVVVSDTTSALENSTTVTVITAEELKNSGARTLSDAFKLVPGITTRTAADGTCRIDIRGMRTRQVKLLLNGVPFGSTYDGQFDPDAIPVENIARIKITQGATSVLYGDGGTAGVIDIITKKGTKETHGSVGFQAAQSDLYKVQGSVSGGTDDVDFYAGASYLTRNAYPVSYYFDQTANQDSQLRKNSDRQHTNVLANVTYKANESTNLGATVNYFDGSYGKPPIVYEKAADSYAKTRKYERVDSYDGIGTQLAMDHDFDGPIDTRLMVYGNVQHTEDNIYDDGNYDTQNNNNSAKQRSTSTTLGLNNQWGYDSDYMGRYTLGLIGEYQNYRETGFLIGTANDIVVEKSVKLYTVALQDDITLFEDFQLSLGLSGVGQSRSEKDASTYSYVVAGNYQIVEGTNFKLSHARKVRFPSVKNLYDSSAGDAELAHETTWHYEAGLTQALPWASTAELTVFRLDADNYIEKGATFYENNDKYQFRGVEFTLSSQFMEGLSTKLGYTFMESENLSDDATFSVLQYRPKHKATAEATYKTTFGTTLFGSFRYLGDQFAFNRAETDYKRIPDYAIVDVKVSQDITKNLSAYVGADNLTDTDYYESYGFPRPGRSVYTGLDYTF